MTNKFGRSVHDFGGKGAMRGLFLVLVKVFFIYGH